MLTRRRFGAALVAAFAAPKMVGAKSGADRKTVLYSGVGQELSCYGVDVASAALMKRGAVGLSSDVQYAWPHPSRQYRGVGVSDVYVGRREE